MDVFVRVMLKDDEGEPFMGIGVVWLLKAIEKHHSVSQAAKEMALSYPKALRMIQTLEDTLRRPMVHRYKGGHQRGGAQLTPQGKDFLQRYLATTAAIQANALRCFKDNFNGFWEATEDDVCDVCSEDERTSEDSPEVDGETSPTSDNL